MKKVFLNCMLLLCALIVGSGDLWGTPTTYSFSSLPTQGWSASGGSQTINSISWTYSSATHISNNSSKIQVGSKNNPQTTAWTIQTPVSSFFSSGKAISKIAITAYTTATTATYSISAGGSIVKSGSLTTSSNTYTADGLNITSGNIIVTLTGSSNSKAMYLSNISVTYDDASNDPVISASNVEIADDATSGEFTYSISNPVDDTDLAASVTVGNTWLSNAVVDAVNGKVTFETSVNEDEENSRVGTIHLVYGDNLATKDVTITQAAAPVKYTVTIDEPTGGTLVVKNGDAVVGTGSKFAVGTELTIIPTPNENYKYVNWQYKKGEGSWNTKSTNYSYVMDANNVEIKANFARTYPVNWSVNGEIASISHYAENENISFPNNPNSIIGYEFVGWVDAEIAGTTDDKPEFLTSPKMGTSEITYYAVFAKLDNSGVTVELKNQTLEYDTWTYSGTTKNMNTYRLFGQDSYIESASINLSILSQVNVYAGTYGTITPAGNKKVTVMAGSTSWGTKDLTTNKEGTLNEITSEVELTGTGVLHIVAGGGDGNSTGIRISKVEIFTAGKYSTFRTTVPTSGTITLNSACNEGGIIYGTFYTNEAYIMHDDLVGSIVSVNNLGKLSVDEVYNGGDVVPANTALLISTADEFVGQKNYTINYSTGGDDWSEHNMLKGTLTADETTVGENCLFYRLTMHNGTDIGFWWGAAGGGAFQPGAHKAYLAVPTTIAQGNAPMRFWMVDEENNATDIKSIEGNEVSEKFIENGQLMIKHDGIIYDALGRKIR